MLMYNFYPLLAGFVALPPLQLKPLSPENIDQGMLDEVITRYVPTHIFVLVSLPLIFNLPEINIPVLDSPNRSSRVQLALPSRWRGLLPCNETENI